jgi:hypothetical protein
MWSVPRSYKQNKSRDSREFGPEVNTEKTKYMLLSRQQNAGLNHGIKVGNRCFENVARFRYMGTIITNQTLIQEKIKRRLNSGNDWYHSVQKLLSSCLLSKNIKIRIYKTTLDPLTTLVIILNVICYSGDGAHGSVVGSNPDEVIGFSNWPNPSSRTMILGSTLPLTEMSTRNHPAG